MVEWWYPFDVLVMADIQDSQQNVQVEDWPKLSGVQILL